MLAYGVVLVVTGITEFNNPPPNEVLLPWLEALHPTLWWGVVLTVFGGFYSIRFRPGGTNYCRNASMWITIRRPRSRTGVNSGVLWRSK